MFKTGLSKLDKLLGGGFLDETITLVSGPTGVGKSTLAMNILINNVKLGHRAIYIVLEQTKADIEKAFSTFTWNIEEYFEMGTIMVIDYPYHEISQFTAPANPLKALIKKYDVTKVVIDSIMPLALSAKDEFDRTALFAKVVERMKEWQTDILVLSDGAQPKTHQEYAPSSWRFETFADNWLTLNYDFSSSTNRWMRIVKAEGIPNPLDPIPFSITKNGVKV